MTGDLSGPEGQTIGEVSAVRGAAVVGRLLTASGGAPVRIGELVAMRTSDSSSYGLVHALRLGRRAGDGADLEVQLLGELAGSPDGPRFRRGLSACPPLGTPIHRASRAEAALVYGSADDSSLTVGRLRSDNALKARLRTDDLLGWHLAILGSTGAGKSCAVAVILNAIFEGHPFARVLLLDAHDEYRPALGERALHLDSVGFELPYWLLSYEELAGILGLDRGGRALIEAAILRDAVLRARQLQAGDRDGSVGIAADSPVPYRLSDLVRLLEDSLGGLNKTESAAAYRHLLARLAAVREDQRYAFIFQTLSLRDNLEAILGRLLRLPGGGRPVTRLDLSSVPSEIVDVVVAALCRLVVEFAAAAEPGSMPPLLFVCEEAHRYAPSDPGIGYAPARRAMERLAREGRRYGIALCMVSQRPAELAPSSLAQCGTVIALRMTNERDLDIVRTALPDGFDWLVRELPGLANGEAVVVGQGVQVPMQIRLTELPAERRPAIRASAFGTAWAKAPGDGSDADAARLLTRAVGRWRRQGRA